MKLSEAVAHMEAGKKVKHDAWADRLEYVCILHGRIQNNYGDTIGLCTLDGWEIWTPTPEPHTFIEAMAGVKAGEKWARRDWRSAWVTIPIWGGAAPVRFFDRGATWEQYYAPTFEDLAATDWEQINA